jgi:hypothetical protein
MSQQVSNTPKMLIKSQVPPTLPLPQKQDKEPFSLLQLAARGELEEMEESAQPYLTPQTALQRF